ncbi:MAG: hypothetical protein ACLPYS_05055 [Vulcanimicrobiaceae bacterium]
MSRAAIRAENQPQQPAPLTERVLVAIEGDCCCRVRNTLTGRNAVYAVSPRVFDALKHARGRVTVFVQDEKIVGFVI